MPRFDLKKLNPLGLADFIPEEEMVLIRTARVGREASAARNLV
jgi:hypothetical protein